MRRRNPERAEPVGDERQLPAGTADRCAAQQEPAARSGAQQRHGKHDGSVAEAARQSSDAGIATAGRMYHDGV